MVLILGVLGGRTFSRGSYNGPRLIVICRGRNLGAEIWALSVPRQRIHFVLFYSFIFFSSFQNSFRIFLRYHIQYTSRKRGIGPGSKGALVPIHTYKHKPTRRDHVQVTRPTSRFSHVQITSITLEAKNNCFCDKILQFSSGPPSSKIPPIPLKLLLGASLV